MTESEFHSKAVAVLDSATEDMNNYFIYHSNKDEINELLQMRKSIAVSVVEDLFNDYIESCIHNACE